MNIIKRDTLNPLQRAYLMGRNTQVPLGGVAMHDVREFCCDFTEESLKVALHALVDKHPVLRSKIDEVALEKHVFDDVVLNLAVKDWRDLTKDEAEQKLSALRKEIYHAKLPLDKSLWHMTLMYLPESDETTAFNQVLFTQFDGLILDGYAISILLGELFDDKDNHKPIKVRQAPTSYFANSDKDKGFWQKRLDKIEEVIGLPWLQDLDTITEPRYQRQGVTLNQTDWQSILGLAAKNRLLPNSLLTAAILDVISLWVSDEVFAVSMPISNAVMHSELSNHSSFIALVHEKRAESSLLDKAQNLQKEVLESMGHTSFSGVELGKLLLKQTGKLVSLPVAITNGLNWGSNGYKKAEYVSGITQTPQLALDIRLYQTAEQNIAIDFDYATQALPSLVVEEMLTSLKSYLTSMANHDDLAQLPPVSLSTDQNKAMPWQDTAADGKLVQDYLAQIKDNLFGKQKDRRALVYDDRCISYEDLGRDVAKLINHFADLGVKKGHVVAICLNKSPEHIAVTLACSLANILWLPIDMDSPKERIQYMLDNCCVDWIISDQTLEFGINTLNIHQILNDGALAGTIDCTPVFNGEPGYYLYTSGSTGAPKCVVMNHLATANVVEETNRTWGLTSEDVMFSATPFHHDMSVYELFAAMSLGASLVVPTKEQAKSGMDWARLVETYKVSVWSSVPAIVDMLLVCAEPNQLASLKLVSQGGDYVKPTVIEKLRQYLPHARLFSIGGPTETTIWNIWHEITPEDLDIIPYGTSFKHNRYYILNDQGQHCPSFVVGTLCASGVNLANGYLKEGVINQMDFEHIKTPEGQVVRVFKTSDRGFFREDGKIIFSGRKQGYLKIRGVRIASSEVELAMTKHPHIRDAIVMACTNPQYQTNEMVAAYVPEKGHDVSNTELRQFLKSKLPNSHIPSRWLPLNEFPLTRNRKVDRKGLKAMAEARFYDNEKENAPRSPLNNGLPLKQAGKQAGLTDSNSVNQTSESKFESCVLEVFSQTLNVSTSFLSLDTEVLSLGVRPNQLAIIAKDLAKRLNLDVSLFSLVKAVTLKDVLHVLEEMSSKDNELAV